MISKENRYNRHYGEVRGDVLGPPWYFHHIILETENPEDTLCLNNVHSTLIQRQDVESTLN